MKLNPGIARVCREAVVRIDDAIAGRGEWSEPGGDTPVRLIFDETGLPEEDFRAFLLAWTLRGYAGEVDALVRSVLR